MRLTLRTMLCYLDDILEPEDKADLGKKIEDSEFATNLVHRIRDVSQKLRLGSPKLTGKGMGLDPNTVAEYLDNVLSNERIPDFEKVCLESDVHLAEVACSHQILTLVLGEAAQVEPSTRRAIYELGGGKTVGVDEPQTERHGPPPRPQPAKSKPEIPDYLRSEPRRVGWGMIAATLLLAAGAGGVAVMAIGPEKVAKLIGLRKGAEPQIAEVDPGQKPVPGPTLGSEQPPADLPADTGPASGGAVASFVDPKPLPTDTAPPKPDTIGFMPTEPPLPVDPVLGKPVPTDVASNVKPKPMEDVKPLPIDVSKPPQPDVPGKVVDPAVAPAAGSGVAGILASDDEVLLKWNPSGRWERVAPQEQVRSGDALLVCPTYRPTVLLSEGISMRLGGDTFVQLVGPEKDKDGIPGLNIGYGRVILTAAGKSGTRLRITVGERSGMVIFGDGPSEVACEVRLFHALGTNPEKNLGQAAVELYASSGLFRWQEKPGDDLQVVTTPNRIVIAPYPGETNEVPKDLPRWIKAEQVSDIDRRASKIVFKSLADAPDVSLRLRELATHRSIENRTLAIRCLSHLGEFEDLVSSLRDDDVKTMWQPYFESLQAAIARNPEQAAKIRLTLEKQRGDKAADLYRLLWGYSRQDLEGGQAAKLVDYLDNEDLDFRVLAFLNLKAITGMNLLYRPEVTAAQRKQSVTAWKQRLKENGIVSKAKAG